MTRSASFGAVVDARTRLLILGSLPGVRSLAAAQYYAHPGNRFWELIGAVIDRDLRVLPYAARLTALAAAGVGLWDTVASAERAGSLDSAIRAPQANDIAAVLASLPGLRAVAFNGQTAARLARAIDFGAAARIVLPSSSAAHAVTLPVKLSAWLELRRFLAG